MHKHIMLKGGALKNASPAYVELLYPLVQCVTQSCRKMLVANRSDF